MTLRSTPRLSGWNRSGESGGARLTRSLGYSEHLLVPRLEASPGPVALRFDVGLPRAVRLLDERDLDNYLLPLTARLESLSPQPVVSVWGGKRYADETTLRIEPAVQAPPPVENPEQSVVLRFRTRVIGARDDFKEAFRQEVHALVAERMAGRVLLPDGPVVLELSFVVGPARDWLDLWWSTIDALGPLLGQLPAHPAFHPRDGRIVDLGLHRTVDPDLGDDVVVALRATPGWLPPVPQTGTLPPG